MKPDDIKQLSELIDQKLEPIQKELKNHGKLLKNHGKLLRTLKKDQDIMLDMLDREQMRQAKKISRIEKHLDLPPFVS